MIRGLVIRQTFVLLDVVLAVGILAAAGAVVYKVLDVPMDSVLEPNVSDLGNAGDGGLFTQEVGERSVYDAFVNSGIFGDAGKWDAKVDAPPPEPEGEGEGGEITETDLNLRLAGTVALSPKDPFAAAFIENLDQRGSLMGYALGQEVVEKVTLEEVYPREVILLNARSTPAKRQRLSMEEEAKTQTAAATDAAPKPSADGSGPNRVELNRQEFVQELYTNYADLVTKVQPEMYRDASGKIIGVTAQNIGQVPLAGKLGLQDGDVLQSVNNESIDSEQKILEMVQKYRNANSFRIGIMRNGQPQVITYKLN